MRQRDAKFVPQVSFSSIWQLPVQTALNAQKSTLPMTIDFLFAAQPFYTTKRQRKTADAVLNLTYRKSLPPGQPGPPCCKAKIAF